jgi:3-isopropylmalate/(R)-2-methylmalate dehydratase small subunit
VPGATDLLRDGDHVRLDIRRAAIERVEDGRRLEGSPLPALVLDILDHGGLMPKLAADGYLPAAVGAGS